VLGSAVNPVLREGNSDRRCAAPVKEHAKKVGTVPYRAVPCRTVPYRAWYQCCGAEMLESWAWSRIARQQKIRIRIEMALLDLDLYWEMRIWIQEQGNGPNFNK
jgi:hypothetical protein